MMFRFIVLAALMTAAGPAQADPILTPLIASAVTSSGFVATTTTVTAIASIVSYTLTAGAAYPLRLLQGRE